ncbi:MAG: putative membrane protein YedE/YeeE [Alphaproteobacteria bacterium]|jgi:uncharacterized membrane protein YedE/YeeE
MNTGPRPYWHPLAAGAALGLVLAATFLVTGHGLGASGFFTALAAAVGRVVDPAIIAANSYLNAYATGNPFAGWISWQVLGLVLGAGAGAMSAGRFRLGIEKGAGLCVPARLGWALLGGVLVGFGARLARGCTSGLGLSGGATLSVAAFVFLAAFFAAGFVTMGLVRRTWR